MADPAAQILLADIGTGTGCIAISLLSEISHARAVATDVSTAAVEVARRNAASHAVADRLELLESDGLTALTASEQFNLIVSNPPYIPEPEIHSLPREVLHEPHKALFAGQDGLEVIRCLLRQAPAYLQRIGHLVLEIGFGQNEAVQRLVDRQVWNLVEIRSDLQGIPRTLILGKK